jgi:hypothetical protein
LTTQKSLIFILSTVHFALIKIVLFVFVHYTMKNKYQIIQNEMEIELENHRNISQHLENRITQIHSLDPRIGKGHINVSQYQILA